MTSLPVAAARGSRLIRRLTMASLTLTLVAMLLGLLFIFHTNGGTVFLFSAVAPVLVLLAVAMFLIILALEFRQAHRLFSIERHPGGSTIFRQGGSAYLF